jgi:hypothetical protein
MPIDMILSPLYDPVTSALKVELPPELITGSKYV